MTSKIPVDLVPPNGQLSLGAVYRRADLHIRFGGSRFSGIVPSKQEPVILLFHTQEPVQQFYRDGFDGDGIYWYSAEGSSGDMTWTPSNRAVRDQAMLGLDLFFFERVQRKDGLWRFAQIFYYFSHKQEQRPDKTGNTRAAIIFGLLSVTATASDNIASSVPTVDPCGLRIAAMAIVDPEKVGVQSAIRNVYLRSEAVRQYALGRAGGECEACGSVATFKNILGVPFLEVHHIARLADSGPDRVDRVAALCPNCHRRCHYSSDRLPYNSALRDKIAAVEQLYESP